MTILIRGGRVVDPSQSLDAELDVLIDDEVIAEVGPPSPLAVPYGCLHIGTPTRVPVPRSGAPWLGDPQGESTARAPERKETHRIGCKPPHSDAISAR